MSRPRLVFVTRRFWPLVGGSETSFARLAEGLTHRDCEVTILTACWQASWPREVQHHGCRVIRLPQPDAGICGRWQYGRGLRSWLSRNPAPFDLVLTGGDPTDVRQVLRAARRRGFPVVLHADRPLRMRRGRWSRLLAVVVGSAILRDQLLAAGCPESMLHLIPPGVPIADRPTTTLQRQAARRWLMESTPNVFLPPDGTLGVYLGKLAPDKGLDPLLLAWQRVQRTFPGAYLWLVGAGRWQQRLQQRIQQLGLAGRVAMLGPFDEVDEVLQAANLFVLPSRTHVGSLALVEALGAGLPVVAVDTPANRECVAHREQAWLVPDDSPDALAAGLMRLLGEPALADELGTSALHRAGAEFALSTMLDRYQTLLQLCIETQTRSPRR